MQNCMSRRKHLKLICTKYQKEDMPVVLKTDGGETKGKCLSSTIPHTQPEDHWSCIAHLSAEDMLKSAVIEEKKFKILNLSDLDQGQ